MSEQQFFEEDVTNDVTVKSRLVSTIHQSESKFQKVNIYQTVTWGKTLVLDGSLQSASSDEFCYHESLVHPPLLTHPNPKTVFVGGGGEGATVREVLRHKSVERVVMVDIDQVCVDVCIQYLPELHQGSLSNPKTLVVIEDAKKWLESTPEKFDVILLDLVDPHEGGPAQFLYTKEFYQMIQTKLNPGGVFNTQAGPCGVATYQLVYSPIYKTVCSVFPRVLPYGSFVPSFVDFWGFHMAIPDGPSYVMTPQEVDRRIQERLVDPNILKFYDGAMHQAIFTFPKIVRENLAKEQRIITNDHLLSLD